MAGVQGLPGRLRPPPQKEQIYLPDNCLEPRPPELLLSCWLLTWRDPEQVLMGFCHCSPRISGRSSLMRTWSPHPSMSPHLPGHPNASWSLTMGNARNSSPTTSG